MVDWPTWVGIVAEVVEDAGVEVNAEVFGEVTQAASVLWQDDTLEIEAMTRAEARATAEAEIEVEL